MLLLEFGSIERKWCLNVFLCSCYSFPFTSNVGLNLYVRHFFNQYLNYVVAVMANILTRSKLQFTLRL